jgi:hypothetical protein
MYSYSRRRCLPSLFSCVMTPFCVLFRVKDCNLRRKWAHAEWFRSLTLHGARATLLLALLELAHKGLVLLHQSGDFTTIGVKALHEFPEEVEIEGFSARKDRNFLDADLGDSLPSKLSPIGRMSAAYVEAQSISTLGRSFGSTLRFTPNHTISAVSRLHFEIETTVRSSWRRETRTANHPY